jgi:hypothetical protein
MKLVIKPLAIAALLIAALTPTVAQVPDELPYKEDGPRREYFLRTSLRNCMQEPWWKKMAANEKETTQFCECKVLFTADIWTREDDLEFYRAKASNTKLPAETYLKWEQANLACQKHFSKLPKAPSRPNKQ